MAKRPNRKRPASGVLYIEGQPTVIFDTVCTKSKVRWLADPLIHQTLIDVWTRDATAWLIGRYVIMPDHIHYFAWATDTNIEFDAFVTFWKSRFSKAHGFADRRLQAGEWDTRMRTEFQYRQMLSLIHI